MIYLAREHVNGNHLWEIELTHASAQEWSSKVLKGRVDCLAGWILNDFMTHLLLAPNDSEAKRPLRGAGVN